MPRTTIYKLDANGREVIHYVGQVLDRQAHCIRIDTAFNLDDLDVGFAIFKRGDRFIETFYSDRWYNVFAIYDRDDGRFKGWYCNICRPAQITATAVRCEDLALDVWKAPAGKPLVLDEDEFAALELDARETAACRAALETVLALAERGELPR